MGSHGLLNSLWRMLTEHRLISPTSSVCPIHAVTYWVVRYLEHDGTVLSTPMRVISAHPDRLGLVVWCHSPKTGCGHERFLEVDRFIEVTDIKSGALVDAPRWLAMQSHFLRAHRT